MDEKEAFEESAALTKSCWDMTKTALDKYTSGDSEGPRDDFVAWLSEGNEGVTSPLRCMTFLTVLANALIWLEGAQEIEVIEIYNTDKERIENPDEVLKDNPAGLAGLFCGRFIAAASNKDYEQMFALFAAVSSAEVAQRSVFMMFEQVGRSWARAREEGKIDG